MGVQLTPSLTIFYNRFDRGYKFILLKTKYWSAHDNFILYAGYAGYANLLKILEVLCMKFNLLRLLLGNGIALKLFKVQNILFLSRFSKFVFKIVSDFNHLVCGQ